jgi:hypothetical protein
LRLSLSGGEYGARLNGLILIILFVSVLMLRSPRDWLLEQKTYGVKLFGS